MHKYKLWDIVVSKREIADEYFKVRKRVYIIIAIKKNGYRVQCKFNPNEVYNFDIYNLEARFDISLKHKLNKL